MDPTVILQEVRRLNNISNRLESLAEVHPLVAETLMQISGGIRNSATLLAVLVAVKIEPIAPLNPGRA
jgi:hypothetical protein